MNNPTFNFNMGTDTQHLYGYIKDGTIYDYAGIEKGVVIEKYNTAIELAKEFEQQLIQAGIIEQPKTQEEINKELQESLRHNTELMNEMMNTIKQLNERIHQNEYNRVSEEISSSRQTTYDTTSERINEINK